MKNIYWHAHNLPRLIMILFCVFVLAGLGIVEHFKQSKPQPNFQAKLHAASWTYKAFQQIRKARYQHHAAINTSTDPQRSGLIGKQLTDITTDSGNLYSKQTTINPNIAALFVEWLKQLNAKPGDVVAVGMTGSFPALDIAMLSAIKTLKLKPLIVFSAAASQYGANLPDFSWLVMYHNLVENNIFNFPVLGVSLGGKRDYAYGVNKKGRQILIDTIKKYHYPYLDSKGTIDGISKRMAIYEKDRKGMPILAYINVGGSVASIGLKQINHDKKVHTLNKPHSLKFGVITRMPISLANVDSVAVRFLKQGVPVINAHNVGRNLVEQYKFPAAPRYEPLIGTGILFYQKEYNTWLAIIILALDIIVFIIIALISKKYVIRYKKSG